MARLVALLIVLCPLLTGCFGSLFSLDLTVVGEKTALERQVLGTYEAMGRDLTSFSSVRAVQPDGSLQPPPPMTESQVAVAQALNNRRYNRDDLDVLLSAQVFGEAATSLVVVRNWGGLAGTDIARPLAEQILLEENADREIILERLMTTTPGVEESDLADVQWVLAQLNQSLAPAGSAVETREGAWGIK